MTLPDLAEFLACSRVVMAAESFAIHRNQLARNFLDYGAGITRRLVLGAGVSTADYLDAQRLRGSLATAVDVALAPLDAALTAISLGPPPSFASQGGSTAWPLQASPFNVTGHPAITVPTGLDLARLPLAVQVVGRRFDEATILRVAKSIEQLTNWKAHPAAKQVRAVVAIT